MKRKIWILQQYPTKMRYSEWFGTVIEQGLRQYGLDACVIDNHCEQLQTSHDESFSPLLQSVKYELASIERLYEVADIDNDIVFVLDPSFPGYVTNLCTYFRNIVCYCHATCLNQADIFADVVDIKKPLEETFLKHCACVFVATTYHKQKLEYGFGLDNVYVVGFPYPPTLLSYKKIHKIPADKRINKLLLPVRNCAQKIDPEIYACLVDLPFEIRTFKTWDSYYDALSHYKFVVSLAQEETFGISIAEAVELGTPVLVPDKCAYVELYGYYFRFIDADHFRVQYNVLCKYYDDYVLRALETHPFNNDFISDIVSVLSQIYEF